MLAYMYGVAVTNSKIVSVEVKYVMCRTQEEKLLS